MKNEAMKKNILISRIIVTILVFTILNIWFMYENDPQFYLAGFISLAVFFINFLSSKICIFIINKGDKIVKKIYRFLYYVLLLPVIFLLLLFIVLILLTFIFEYIIPISLLDFGTAILIVFIGIGLFPCILVLYFQTLIILILRYLEKRVLNNNC